ncbi:MAG TPA: hypothetical protein ENK57_19735 [Polyangiaceae bacterium]|nr:hypothetical protein [Polyangiaceae bacterium]
MMHIDLISRERADRAELFAALEDTGWRCVALREHPYRRTFEWSVEPHTLLYQEVPGLGLRFLAHDGPLPDEASRWAAPISLAQSALEPWKLTLLGESEDPSRELIPLALDDDPGVYRVILRQALAPEVRRPILEALVDRFGQDTERGAFARAALRAMNPSDEARALAQAAEVPALGLLAALREAFHGGDAWLTLAVGDRLLADRIQISEIFAMRGEACRQLGRPWSAAVDLLIARQLTAEGAEVEPAWATGALEALGGELARADAPEGVGPMPAEALRHLMEASPPHTTRAVLETLSALPHGQPWAMVAHRAVLALADRDRAAAVAAAREALAARPEDTTTMAVLALSVSWDRDDEILTRFERAWESHALAPDEVPTALMQLELEVQAGLTRAPVEADSIGDRALSYLEEAWRRLRRGPVDDHDDALLGVAVTRFAVDLERVAERRLDALKARGLMEELTSFGEEAHAALPWSIEIGLTLGIAYTMLEEHARAVETYGRVIAHAERDRFTSSDDPNVATCYFNRACERALTGEREGALADLAEAIRGRRAFADKAATDAHFDALRGDPRFDALCRGEVERRRAVIEGPLAPIAEVLIGAAEAVPREVMSDALRRANRGEAPPPTLARMPGVPEALSSLTRLLSHRDLLLEGRVTLELYAAGEFEFDQALAKLAPAIEQAVGGQARR